MEHFSSTEIILTSSVPLVFLPSILPLSYLYNFELVNDADGLLFG